MASDVPAELAAGCKVNLSLRVTGRQEDGYHTLESIFWPLPFPGDTLRVVRGNGGGLRFSCNDSALRTSDNIVVKAYNAFAGATGFVPALSVHLEKCIPYGAGLGGGSSDAAALLIYLNGLAEEECAASLSIEELSALGARLGADVPFFFRNTPSQVAGIGDILEPLPQESIRAMAGVHLVLVCPAFHVSTAWAFNAWDQKYSAGLTNGNGNDTSPLVRGMRIQNDLCGVVFERYPQLEKTLAAFHALGADAASMSGTGASLFGLFSDQHAAENAIRVFRHAGERVFHHIL